MLCPKCKEDQLVYVHDTLQAMTGNQEDDDTCLEDWQVCRNCHYYRSANESLKPKVSKAIARELFNGYLSRFMIRAEVGSVRGLASDGQEVELGNDVESVVNYLTFRPLPSDW